jgi:hypothetical protein
MNNKSESPKKQTPRNNNITNHNMPIQVKEQTPTKMKAGSSSANQGNLSRRSPAKK